MRSSVLFASAFLISGFVYLAGCAQAGRPVSGAQPVETACSTPQCAKPDQPAQPVGEAQQQDVACASQNCAKPDDQRVWVQLQKEDRNHDGTPDSWVYFENGVPVHAESDENFDGKVDRWVTYADGQVSVVEDDCNGDGKPDSWVYFKNGVPVHAESDENFDGKVDRWVTYADGQLSVVEGDWNHDGKVDLRTEFNPDGTKKVEYQDIDGDGKWDTTTYYENGRKVRVEEANPHAAVWGVRESPGQGPEPTPAVGSGITAAEYAEPGAAPSQ
ncbi:MAG TPA: hypothetical protein VKM54_00565 [Myxococcota bacterium]|nr:hypothetical protein [Myxococcota bacterium]